MGWQTASGGSVITASPEFKSDVESFMTGVERLGRLIGKVIDWVTGKTDITLDDVKSHSSMLSDEKRTDPQSGQTYTPGTDDDPHVWGWLKGVKHFSPVAKLSLSMRVRRT